MVGMSKRVCVMWVNVDARAITGVIGACEISKYVRLVCPFDLGTEGKQVINSQEGKGL